MEGLEFKITGDWRIRGSSEKEWQLYISFVAKINDWKRNIVFRRSEVGEEAFNSIYVSRAFWIKDQDGNTIFTGEEKEKNA